MGLGISSVNLGQAFDPYSVKITGDQAISGLKDFAARPQVNSSGVLLNGEAYGLNNPSGFITGVDLSNYYTNANPSGYITGVDLSSYVTASQTGIFYTKDNPSGYITGVDTSNFYTKDNPSGYITGVDTSNFYTKDNPSGFITGVDLSSYVTASQTGIFYTNDNPSGFITSQNIVYTTGQQDISGLKNFTNVTETFLSLNIINQTINFPLNSGMNFILPLTTGITGITFSNVPSNIYSFTLRVDYSGAHAIVWPVGLGGVLWPGNTAPTLTTTVGREDFFSFLTYTSGQEFFGFNIGQNYSGTY